MSGLTTNLKPIKKAYGIGLEQEFIDYEGTGDRERYVNYTNTTGKTMFVAVTFGAVQNGSCIFYVDDKPTSSIVVGNNVYYGGAVYGLVPNGSTYRAEGNSGVRYWLELG